MNFTSRNVLYADSDHGEAALMRQGFEKARVQASLYVVSDGLEVVKYLQGASPYRDQLACPSPDLLLLNLKMPRRGGSIQKLLLDLQRRCESTSNIADRPAA